MRDFSEIIQSAAKTSGGIRSLEDRLKTSRLGGTPAIHGVTPELQQSNPSRPPRIRDTLSASRRPAKESVRPGWARSSRHVGAVLKSPPRPFRRSACTSIEACFGRPPALEFEDQYAQQLVKPAA